MLRLAPATLRRLVLLAVVSTLAIGVIAVRYLGVFGAAGIGVRDVTLELPDASGLHESAAVTWRGVQIGRVTGVRVRTDGVVEAGLRLEDRYDVPADVVAHLHESSPIGEDYVDLEAPAGSTSATTLAAGAVIPRDRVVLPVTTSAMIDSVDDLLGSVPRGSLTDVLTQLSAASRSLGTDLGSIVDSGSSLEQAATDNLGATTGLIDALVPVLGTQAATGAEVKKSAGHLSRFSSGVRRDDAAIRRLLEVSTPLITQARGLTADLSGTLPGLLADTATVAGVLHTYVPNLEHMLILLPALESAFGNLLHGKSKSDPFDYLKLDFKTPLNDPPPCTTGYADAANQRSPNDMSSAPAPSDSYCKLAKDDPRGVRGVRNDPCPDSSVRAPTAAGCGLLFPRYSETGPERGSATTSNASGVADGTAQQDVTHREAAQKEAAEKLAVLRVMKVLEAWW